jgi:hypothetical protein
MLLLAGLDISDNERLYIGEALIVYLFRALNKPAKPTYFHVELLDVLIKNARDSLQLGSGISWAKGTDCLTAFNRNSNLDEHPHAPAEVAASVIRGENFAKLSEGALNRIAKMTSQKRRQLEAIAAAIFPDHEAIEGRTKAYEGARLVPGNLPSNPDEMKECAKEMLQAVRADADKIIGDVDGICDAAIADVEGAWSNRKMDVVPGSAILDEVYKTFAFRYDKMRDGVGIASQMRVDEIDAELRDFLEALAQNNR